MKKALDYFKSNWKKSTAILIGAIVTAVSAFGVFVKPELVKIVLSFFGG